MSRLTFNHVFIALLVVAFLSSFVIVPRRSITPLPPVQLLFAPVARPVSSLAGWVNARFASAKPLDPEHPTAARPSSDVYDENQQLRLLVGSLTSQLQRLAQINAEREAVGDIRDLCTPFAVIGADAGKQKSLILQGTTAQGLAVDQPVLKGYELIGRVVVAGMGGAMVRLVTDDHFRATGGFARFSPTEAGTEEYVPIASAAPLVEGTGGDLMMIRNLSLRDVQEAGVQAGDWVVLNDVDWPIVVQGRRLGRVVSVNPSTNALYAELQIKPASNLMTIREVMVLTKK